MCICTTVKCAILRKCHIKLFWMKNPVLSITRVPQIVYLYTNMNIQKHTVCNFTLFLSLYINKYMCLSRIYIHIYAMQAYSLYNMEKTNKLLKLFSHLFLLVESWLLYNIVVVFAIHWHESAMDLQVFPSPSTLPPPSPSHPSGSSQCTSPEHLSHASNLGWWSVSPLIVYLFQCYSLRTSHPCLLPQSPKVCSVHLCLFFCLAYRVIVTIFLKSIYMC